MRMQRFIVADADAGRAVINQLKQNISEFANDAIIEETFIVNNDPVGVHLACPETEYELGWMVFNSSNKDELIAFVYDGGYTELEGELTLDDATTVRSAAEWLDHLDQRRKRSAKKEADRLADLEAKEVDEIATIFNNRNEKTAEQIAEELLESFPNLPRTSVLLRPHRTVVDLEHIFDVLEEKSKTDKNMRQNSLGNWYCIADRHKSFYESN